MMLGLAAFVPTYALTMAAVSASLWAALLPLAPVGLGATVLGGVSERRDPLSPPRRRPRLQRRSRER